MTYASAIFGGTDAEHLEEIFGCGHKVVTEPEQLVGTKFLVLWGGEDISPSIYGELVTEAHASATPSRRDIKEMALARKAFELGIPILGLCRGAQLVCALLGGKLWQHVDNHESSHGMVYGTEILQTNSIHHQMMIPTDDMQILAYTPCLSPHKYNASGLHLDEGDEPEVVWAPKAKSLLVQGHPEWVNKEHDLYQLTKQLVKEYL